VNNQFIKKKKKQWSIPI